MSADATDFTKAGFSPALAEAFEGRRLTVAQANAMDSYDLLDHYLRWNGIIGYTWDILGAVNSINAVKETRK